MTCAENTERNLRNYYEDESHLSGQTSHLRQPHQCLYEQKDFLKCNITTDQDFFSFYVVHMWLKAVVILSRMYEYSGNYM